MKTPSVLIAVLLCGFVSETLHAQTPIANWHELNQIRGALSGDYVLVNVDFRQSIDTSDPHDEARSKANNLLKKRVVIKFELI